MALTSAIASAYLSVSRWKLSTQPLPDKVIRYRCPAHLELGRRLHGDFHVEVGRTFSFLVKDSVVKTPVLAGSSRRSARFPWSAARPTASSSRSPSVSASPTRSRCASPRGDAFAA